jgi:hypothetical protein
VARRNTCGQLGTSSSFMPGTRCARSASISCSMSRSSLIPASSRPMPIVTPRFASSLIGATPLHVEAQFVARQGQRSAQAGAVWVHGKAEIRAMSGPAGHKKHALHDASDYRHESWRLPTISNLYADKQCMTNQVGATRLTGLTHGVQRGSSSSTAARSTASSRGARRSSEASMWARCAPALLPATGRAAAPRRLRRAGP